MSKPTGLIAVPRTLLLLINFSIYQINWLLCILGQNSLVLFAILLIGCHYLFSPHPVKDLKLMALITFCGIILDGLLKATGFFTFSSDSWPIPNWLITVWMSLSLLPNYSLHWLKTRLRLAATLGAVGGPVAYWAGVRLGAATFTWTVTQSLLLLALLWGLFWPLMMYFASKLSPDTE